MHVILWWFVVELMFKCWQPLCSSSLSSTSVDAIPPTSQPRIESRNFESNFEIKLRNFNSKFAIWLAHITMKQGTLECSSQVSKRLANQRGQSKLKSKFLCFSIFKYKLKIENHSFFSDFWFFSFLFVTENVILKINFFQKILILNFPFPWGFLNFWF